MNLPKVSVVIPNFNHGAFLKKRIESVIHQTYGNFEVIILDDCSTDSSQEIIAGYASHPAVSGVVLNDKNSGSPFRQWHKGITMAQGDWIWIAESDDYADEKFLEVMIASLKGQDPSGVGLIYCDSKIVSGETVLPETFATLKNRSHNTDRWSINYNESGASEIENYLLPYGTINNTSAVLFNRKLLLEANPFDLDLRYIGDKYTFMKVLAGSRVLYIKEPMNYYRDPFNAKHAGKYVFYFYEQFLVFDWAFKNLPVTDRRKLMKAFYANTGNSPFREWNLEKINLYRKLFKRNPALLFRSVNHNLWQSFRSAIRQTGLIR